MTVPTDDNARDAPAVVENVAVETLPTARAAEAVEENVLVPTACTVCIPPRDALESNTTVPRAPAMNCRVGTGAEKFVFPTAFGATAAEPAPANVVEPVA